jgi:hypothetical protein
MRWLTDIRKVALLACITSVAGLLTSLWYSAQSFIATASQVPLGILIAAPLGVLAFLLTALLPIFYFALYRDERPVQVSGRLRLLARTAAFILGILLAFQLAEWIKSPVSPIPTSLNALATIGNILLLNALSRDAGDQSEDDPSVSALLYVVTKVTVITWGVCVAFNVLRVLLLPYTYSQLRDYALSIGRHGPALADMIKEAVQTFLSQACLLAAPYVVYQSRVKRRIKHRSAQTDTAPASPDPQNPPPS